MSTGPVKLTWRRGTPAPVWGMRGRAVVHGNMAYFSHYYSVYSYTLSQDKWTELKQCNYLYFSMAVINNQLTTIGGQRNLISTNNLLCLSRSPSEMKWEALLPPMPTARRWSAAVTTPHPPDCCRRNDRSTWWCIISCGNTRHQHPPVVLCQQFT